MARFSFVPIAAFAATSFTLFSVPAMRVAAQDVAPGPPVPMQAIYSKRRERTVTETFADMLARDAEFRASVEAGRIPRPPFRNPGPTEVEDEDERERSITLVPPRAGEQFVAPPFIGRAVNPAVTYPNTASLRSRLISGGPLNMMAPSGAPSGSIGFPTVSMIDEISNFYSFSFPPDTMSAVGPSSVVVAINGALGVYAKDGTRIGLVSCNSFFAVPGTPYPRGGGVYDQRVVFDRRSGRWFATTMERGVNQSNNDVILAVSTSSDPTQGWTKYVIPFGRATVAGVSYFTDYSTLGVDDNGVYFAARLFPSSGQSFTKIVITPKASLIAASPSLGNIYVKDNISDIYGTPQPAQNYDAVNATQRAFIVGSGYTNKDIFYYAVDWSGTTPNIPSISATSGNVTTPVFANSSPGAPAAGSSLPLDIGDFRLQQVVVRNNRLWTCRNVGVDASGGATANNRCAAEWLELNASSAALALVQSGRIFDPAASDPRFYYYPSLVVNGQGHVAVGYSGSKSTEFVGAYTSGRLATDPPGTMQGITLLKAGEAKYQISDGTRNRWGDYSYTSLDPSDDMTIWTTQEYAGPRDSYDTFDTWGTWTSALRSQPPSLTAVSDARLAPGRTNQSFTLPGTGFYDPGTGFTNRIAAAITDGATSGITNVRATWLASTPSVVTVTCDVAANASSGARSVTITNPDGQAATLANAVTVGAAAPSLFVTPGTLSRSGADLFMQVRVTNNGGATAMNVTLSSITVQVGGATTVATFVPSVGAVAAGATVTVQARFPSASVRAGAGLYSVKGTYTGGALSSTGRVTVP